MKRKLSNASSRHRNIERAASLLSQLEQLPEANPSYFTFRNPRNTFNAIQEQREKLRQLEIQFAAQIAELAEYVNAHWTEEEIASLPDIR